LSSRKRVEKRIANTELIETIRLLKRKSKEGGRHIWRDAAERLLRSNKKRTTINISKLSRYTKEGETVLVPGKVLGSGRLAHPVTIAAFSFSESARSKITTAKGRCLSIVDLMKENREGSNVKIME